MSDDTYYCPDCGEEIPPISSYCSECGSELNLNLGSINHRSSQSGEERKIEGEQRVDINDSDTEFNTENVSNETSDSKSILGLLFSAVLSLVGIIISLLTIYHASIYILSGDVFSASSTYNSESASTYFFMLIILAVFDVLLNYIWDGYQGIWIPRHFYSS